MKRAKCPSQGMVPFEACDRNGIKVVRRMKSSDDVQCGEITGPLPCMKRFLGLLTLSLLVSFAPASEGPIRVLYFDPQGVEQTAPGRLHKAMEALGRDAIWFDYVSDEKQLTADFLKHYDVVCERTQPSNPAKFK